MTRLAACALLSLVLGCGAKAPSASSASAGESAAPPPTPSERRTLAQKDCDKSGGTVVGDIGDGATHRPDYVCPSGKAPLGNIAPTGGAIAVEGAVCCPR